MIICISLWVQRYQSNGSEVNDLRDTQTYISCELLGTNIFIVNMLGILPLLLNLRGNKGQSSVLQLVSTIDHVQFILDGYIKKLLINLL